MTKKGLSRKSWINATLSLIEKKGGSLDVNMREVSRRLGCAHTNIYNYFDSFEDLRWAAFGRVVEIYGKALLKGLKRQMKGKDYFKRLITNMFDFAANRPGLTRFLSIDPLDNAKVPEKVMSQVEVLKTFYVDSIIALGNGTLDKKRGKRIADIILSYLDGEISNLMNGRYLPGDKIENRYLENVFEIFSRFTAQKHNGIDLSQEKAVLEFPDPGQILFGV